MSRARLTFTALGMAFALPALTGAHSSQAKTIPDLPICTAASDVKHDDTRWEWRLRAYRHLDCVTAIVDEALATGGADSRVDELVTIPRQELERIRIHAWWARDAAGRIGQ